MSKRNREKRHLHSLLKSQGYNNGDVSLTKSVLDVGGKVIHAGVGLQSDGSIDKLASLIESEMEGGGLILVNIADLEASSRYIPDSIRIEVLERDNHSCVICGARFPIELDHIIPLSKGGSNTANNLQVLCEFHNRSKGNR